MARRGIEVPSRQVVPTRLLAGETDARNNERFRAQMAEMLRERDREIEDLLRRVAALEARVEDLEFP
jgi:hypothetical protein